MTLKLRTQRWGKSITRQRHWIGCSWHVSSGLWTLTSDQKCCCQRWLLLWWLVIGPTKRRDQALDQYKRCGRLCGSASLFLDGVSGCGRWTNLWIWFGDSARGDVLSIGLTKHFGGKGQAVPQSRTRICLYRWRRRVVGSLPYEE